MKMKSKVAALAASLVMAGGAQAAVLTYEVSHNFSSYQNNLDGSPAAQPGGGLLAGTISFDSATGALLDAALTSSLPGPGGRTSIYDLDGVLADDVTTSGSISGNVLTLGTEYDYFNVASSGSYRPAHGAALTLDFGTGGIGDATLAASASETFYNYFWRFTVYGLSKTTGVHGSQGGTLNFSLVDTDGGGATDPVLETPLPAAFPLMFAGLAAFGAAARRRRAGEA